MPSINQLTMDPRQEYSWRNQHVNLKTGVTTLSSGHTVDAQKAMIRHVQKSWSTTPGYRGLVESGAWLPDQPFSYSSYGERREQKAMTKVSLTTESYNYYECWGSIEVYSPHASSKFVNRDIHSRLLEKARGAQWDSPVFFAEAGKTVDMVAGAIGKVGALARHLRKGNIVAFISGLHPSTSNRRPRGNRYNRAVKDFQRQFGENPRAAAANTWLEYTYGWTPFLLDAKTAAETLASLQMEEHARIGRVTSTIRAKSKEVIATPSYLTIAGVVWGGDGWIDRSHSLRGVWHFEPDANLNAIGKLGLTNPLNVGWNLLPFSFVADWFIPIGDYLAQLDTPLRFKHKGGSYGQKNEVTGGIVTLRPRTGCTISPRYSKVGTSVRVQRTPMSSMPSMRLRDLWFDPKMGAARVTSSIALLHQNLSRFGRG